MANYNTLKTSVAEVVKTNGNQEITGKLLQQTLFSIINSLGADYQFMGVATPSTNPGTPDQNVAYLAGPGTYPNFNSAIVNDGYIGIFKYNGSWSIENIRSYKVLTAQLLGNDFDSIINVVAGTSHSASIDRISIDVKSGNKFKIQLFNGTGELSSFGGITIYVKYGEDSQSVSIGTFNLANEIEITAANDITSIGLTIAGSNISTTGTLICHIKYGIIPQVVENTKNITASIKNIIGVYDKMSSNILIGYLRQNGTIQADQNYLYCSDYIPVAPGDKIEWCYAESGSQSCFLVFYDSNKTFLGLSYSYSANNATGTRIIASLPTQDAAFCRVSFVKPINKNYTPYLKINEIIQFLYWDWVVSVGVLPSLVADVNEMKVQTGKVNSSDIEISDGYFTQYNVLNKNANYFHLNTYIPVAPGDKIEWCYAESGSQPFFLMCFDANKNWLGVSTAFAANNATGTRTISAIPSTTPFEDIAYIIPSFVKPVNNNYTPYFKVNDDYYYIFWNLAYNVQKLVGTSVTREQILEYGWNNVYNETDIEQRSFDYSKLFLNDGLIETILFFTDAHLLGSKNTFNIDLYKSYIGVAQKYYANLPIDTVIFGGDMLNNGDTRPNAAKKMGYFDATMRKLFKNYLPIIGNHDTNYQSFLYAWKDSQNDEIVYTQTYPFSNPTIGTKLYNNNEVQIDTVASFDSETMTITRANMHTTYSYVRDNTNDIRLQFTHDTQRNLWFRENGNTYYEHNANNTRFFILDTGLDNAPGMSSFRWGQINWLAEKLLSNTDMHIVIAMHIYSIGGSASAWAENIQPMAQNVQLLLAAFNQRGTITLNGHTYNFASCVGVVGCILCGHTHYDYVDESGAIPVICTANMTNGNIPTFDLMFINYSENKLYAIRVGTGENRIVNLSQ